MKDKYFKPLLVAETFALTQSIAVNCGDPGDINTINPDLLDVAGHTFAEPSSTCGYKLGDGYSIVFNGGICNTSSTEVEYMCYNNPSGGFSIFGS